MKSVKWPVKSRRITGQPRGGRYTLFTRWLIIIAVGAGAFLLLAPDERPGLLPTGDELEDTGISPAPGRIPEGEDAKVTLVIDGDTIEVQLMDATGRIPRTERVRYIGVDTPEAAYSPGETVECYAAEATAYNRELVQGKVVRLVTDVTDRDQYGRLLRYIYVGRTFVNLALAESGHARAIFIRPNVAEYPRLRDAQEGARAEGLGLWGACD